MTAGTDADCESRARDLATRYGLAYSDDEAIPAGAWSLHLADRWELRPPGLANARGCAVAWDPSRPARDLSRRQPIARACGRHDTVWDATGGWGQDSFLLAQLGYHVTVSERCLPLAILLAEAASALRQADLPGTIRVEIGDSCTLLQQLAVSDGDRRPDVIYVDPMFPPKRKSSALPKKEIQLLQQLVGTDDDANELLDVACSAARHRVVVKRPPWADEVRPGPTVTYEGKLVRYDVYYTSRSG